MCTDKTDAKSFSIYIDKIDFILSGTILMLKWCEKKEKDLNCYTVWIKELNII